MKQECNSSEFLEFDKISRELQLKIANMVLDVDIHVLGAVFSNLFINCILDVEKKYPGMGKRVLNSNCNSFYKILEEKK